MCITITRTTCAFTRLSFAMLYSHLDEITNVQELKYKAQPMFGYVKPKKALECHGQPPKWIPHGVWIISFFNSWPTVQVETKLRVMQATSKHRSAETICSEAPTVGPNDWLQGNSSNQKQAQEMIWCLQSLVFLFFFFLNLSCVPFLILLNLA